MAGCPLAVAAAAGGMHYDTLNEWRKANREFSESVEKAEQRAQQLLLGRIRHASEQGMVITRKDGEIVEYPGAWQAAAWLLERRWPAQYARREHVDLTVSVEKVAERIAAQSGLDPAQVIAEAEAIVSGRR